MEESKAAMAQQQQLMQQQLMLQHQFQRRQDAMARFPSNIDAHLRPQMPLLGHRPLNPNSSSTLFSANHITPNPNPNTSPNPNPNPNSNPVSSAAGAATPPTTNISSQPQQSAHHKAALQLAYQDAWRVCHPDFKRPFSSLEDACERLLPYHVVADYEAEEDDKILDSATNGQVLSRSQQWDNNIAAKVAEFTATFEKQVLAFNIISRKRNLGEFRTEEKLMMEQLLLQEERQSLLELRAEMDSRQKSSQETHEANMRMAAMVRAESQAHADMMARGPIRGNALGPQGSGLIGSEMVDQDRGYQQEGILNGWGSNSNAHHKDDKEPSDDFLNDDEAENGDAVLQNEWPEGGELDLNAR